MARTRANGYVNGVRLCSECGADCSARGAAMQGGNLKWRCMQCIQRESDRTLAPLFKAANDAGFEIRKWRQ